MTRSLSMSVVLGVLVLAACASTPRSALLETLKRDLAAVRSTPEGAPFDKFDLAPPQDVAFLRGMTTQDIKLALGGPDCPTAVRAQCVEAAVLEYEFFR